MFQIRTLVFAVAAASGLACGWANALGLGEMTVKSSLNQPLDAEIQLLDVRDLNTDELKSALAANEEFVKAHMARPAFLGDLIFTPVIRPNGKSVLRVTSSKAVREPYLDFLVQLTWPSGRAMREYSLLLDPPTYTVEGGKSRISQLASNAPAVPPIAIPVRSSAPVAGPTAAAGVPPPPVERHQVVMLAPIVKKPVAAPVAPAQPSTPDTYTTTSHDSLWEVAAKHRAGGSTPQSMLAIQELNPDAFIDGNINRLKSGQVLQLPDAQQVSSRSRTEAAQQVAALANNRPQPALAANANQLDATRRAEAGSAPAKIDDKDNLRLLVAKADKTAKGEKGDSKLSAENIAVMREGLDTARREKDELQGRAAELQSQVEKLQRLIQLKDDQLAKLQTSAQASIAAPGDTANPDAKAKAGADNSAASTQASGSTEAPSMSAVAASAAAAPAVASASLAVADAQPASNPEPAAPQSANMLDIILDNPMLLGLVGGGVVAILILLVALVRRPRTSEHEEADLE